MAALESEKDNAISLLQPLSLGEQSPGSLASKEVENKDIECLLCADCFGVDNKEKQDIFLKHLLEQHKLVIADVSLISNFTKYICYWRDRVKEKPLTDVCSVIETNTGPSDIDPREKYFLLCDTLPEDRELRILLQQEKLEEVLQQQQLEREDSSFNRDCLFCKHHFNERKSFFDHLAHNHSFSLGQTDNLVYTDRLINLLEQKLNSFQCLYCEKIYKDRHVLKEHMRKKNHKRINAQNKIYDQFYIVNYLELGKNWEVIQSEEDDFESDSESVKSNDDESWKDWREETGAQATCLFCSEFSSTSRDLLDHMKESHMFDLDQIKQNLHLNFYLQVKLINYIRRQMYQSACINCDEKFPDRKSLMHHMISTNHIDQLPNKSVWDQPQYFFPTYEDDPLLCALDDSDSESEASFENNVIPEELDDASLQSSILHHPGVRQHLMT